MAICYSAYVFEHTEKPAGNFWQLYSAAHSQAITTLCANFLLADYSLSLVINCSDSPPSPWLLSSSALISLFLLPTPSSSPVQYENTQGTLCIHAGAQRVIYMSQNNWIPKHHRTNLSTYTSRFNHHHCKKKKGLFDSIWLPQFHTSSALLNTVETHCLFCIPNSD